MAGYIQLLRAEAAEGLLRYPNAFALLTLIALRARRDVPQINPLGLQVGESLVGDFASLGISRQEFRTALANLRKWSYVTIRSTTQGTIAKLIDSSIYELNKITCNHQVNQRSTNESTNDQPTINQRPTTKENVKNVKNIIPMSDLALPAPDGLGFEVFWQVYGRKEGSKSKMGKQWAALNAQTRQTILAGLPAYRTAKTVNGPHFLPMPQTFLNGKLWDCETFGQAAPLLRQTPNEVPSNWNVSVQGPYLAAKGMGMGHMNDYLKPEFQNRS